METSSKSVGDVFAESWKSEEENLNSPEAQAAKTLAENLNASSLPGLKRLYEETTDAPARAMMEFFLREKTTEMMQELGEIDGYENTLRWAAEKKRDNQIDDAFLEAAFEIIKEKARQPQPGVSLQDAEAFIKATPDVFDDLAKGLYGIIRYTPQAAFETAREIKIEELNRARKLLGMEPIKQPETPATKLLTYGALQGTYETGRLLQRLGRIVTLGVEDFDDESIRKRFKEDLDLIDTMVSFERGQTKAKDEKTGKPVQVVAEEDVEMISPIGEFASLDNAASLGAGVLAKNLTKAGAKTLSQRLVSAAPRLMTIAERRASQAAAEEAARQAVSLPRRALGTTVESVGTAAQKVAESPTARGAIAGGVTLATGGSVPAAAMAAVGGGSSVGRQVVKNVPGAITRTGKAIKAPITGPIGKLTEVVGDIQRGMVAGTATMAPLALPAETVEERATLLAGGAVAGGFGAGADVARNSVRQFGRSMWTPSNQVVPEFQRAKTTAYGTADLDAAHASYVNQLPADAANRIEALRDLIGDKNELYVIDPATYDSLDQTQAGGAKSSGVVYATGQNGRRIALVRGGSESLMHEVGHVVFNSLPAASQKQLRDAVLDGYTPEQLEQMREYYTSRGIDLPDTDTLIEEVVAENFQVALNGSPLSQLGTPGNLAARIYNSVGILAERVGLRGIVPGTDVVTSQTLQFTPSFIAVNAINALRQAGQFDLAGTAGPVTPPEGPAAAAPTPPPVVSTAEGAPVAPEAPPPAPAAPTAPAAPAVTPVSVTPAEPGQTTPRPARSIYTTPERREEITTQEATPEVEAANRQTLATELAKPRADRRPIQVGYNSAKADEARTDGPLKLNEPQRAEQRALADEGEAAGIGDQFREVYDKVTIPYKAQDTKKGGTTLFAFSLDKVIRNIDMLGAWLRRNPDAAARLTQVTGVQSLESPQFRAQFQNWLQNQANGWRGDGKPLVKTEDTRAEDIPDPTPGYTPVPVPEGASKLINSLMGLRNAIDYGEGATAAQSYVQRLAKANGAAVVEVREVPGRKAGEMVPTNEFNLVNKELRDLGFDTNLFHVAIEQLRLKRIATPITFREDLNVRAPVQGTIQIGFMPAPAPAPNTPEFKRWFGDSKVVDANGKPLVVYHGTRAGEFTVFKPSTAIGWGTGIYFTDNRDQAANEYGFRGRVVEAFVSIKRPYTGDPIPNDVLEKTKAWEKVKDDYRFPDYAWEEDSTFINEVLRELGYDGVIADNSNDVQGLEIVAFDPRQVKSATGNTGAFNPENPDIRFMPAGGLTPGQPAATTPENEIPSRRPVQRRFLFEPDTGGAAEFRSALIAAAANHPAGKAVTIKDLADYEQAKLFLDETKTAGLAITPEGDLISVFKAKGSTTDINDILAEAAPEAITLDAYASGKGYLPNLYAKHGFRPVARVEFDRNFAPEGWPYERLGTPDVVLMVNDPKGLSGLPRLDNDYVSKKEEVPLVSYDEALRLQREAVDVVQGKPRAQMMPAEEPGSPLAQETLPTPRKPLSAVSTEPEKSLAAGLQFTPKASKIEIEDAADRVSTRVPVAKKATENALTSQLVITSKDVVRDAGAANRVASLIRSYPGTPKGIKSPKALIAEFQRQISDNLVWLHDQFDAELRERAKLWYDGARKITEDWSNTYDIPRVGIAGALASLSPQKDWFMNVDLARRVIETRANLLNEAVPQEAVNWFKGKFGKENPELLQAVEESVGKPFSDVGLLERAVILRAYDELNSPRSYQIVTPEGAFSGPARNADGGLSKVAWGGFGSIAKALSSIENPTRSNVSQQLGEEHKVRNFYNNILLPNEINFGDVTIDTHAVAAGLLRPLAGGDIEVAQNLGAGYSSAFTGASGIYGVYADAYRDAAERRDRLPREMQSITWEAVRLLFTPEFKTATNKARVNAIWQQVKEGKISPDEARKQIYEIAGGIGTPSWK